MNQYGFLNFAVLTPLQEVRLSFHRLVSGGFGYGVGSVAVVQAVSGAVEIALFFS